MAQAAKSRGMTFSQILFPTPAMGQPPQLLPYQSVNQAIQGLSSFKQIDLAFLLTHYAHPTQQGMVFAANLGLEVDQKVGAAWNAAPMGQPMQPLGQPMPGSQPGLQYG